jgi:glutamate dehydrogenase
VIAYAKHQDTLEVKLERETADASVYIHTSTPGTSLDGATYEQLMDDKFLDISTPKKAYRLESYRSSGNVSSSLTQQLRCYFVFPCNWVDGALELKEGHNDITKVSDKAFLEKVSSNTLQIYQNVMNQALERSGPVVDMFSVEGKREKRLVIAFKQQTSSRFFSGLSHLYHFYGTYSTRKYVEQFANGITIISIYLNPLRGPPIENAIFQIMKEVSLVYCFPNNPFFNPTAGHSVQEAAYAMCGFVFATHFLNR